MTRLRNFRNHLLSTLGLLSGCGAQAVNPNINSSDVIQHSQDVADVFALDIPRVDIVQRDVPPPIDRTLVDVPICTGPSARECLTDQQAFNRAGVVFGGGDTNDAGVEVRYDPATMCVVNTQIYNDCCNQAEAVERESTGLCCYTFCNGGCCGRPLRASNRLIGSIQLRASSPVKRNDWSEITNTLV